MPVLEYQRGGFLHDGIDVLEIGVARP